MMNALNPENLRQDIVEQILPLWKNYIVLSQQLSKVSKGAQYLLDWMTGLLEMKIKSETLKDAKKKFPELQKKVREKIDLIAETNSLIKSLQEKKAQLQQLSQSNNSQILMSQTSNPTRPTMIVSPSNQLQTAKSMPFYSPKNVRIILKVLDNTPFLVECKNVLRKPDEFIILLNSKTNIIYEPKFYSQNIPLK